MTGHKPTRSASERRTRLLASAVCAWALVAVACTGENIFPTGLAVGGEDSGAGGVEITAPADGSSVPVNDSVTVTAKFITSTGFNQLSFTHNFPGGVSQRIFTPGGPVTDTTVSRTLWTGTTVGDGTIVVEARDLLGNMEADTVSVTIN